MRSMDHEAHIPPWIGLLERRDGLITQLRHGVPAVWPTAIGQFLAELKAQPDSLPAGLVVLLLVDLARELDRLASNGPNNCPRERLLATIESGIDATVSAEALCRHFEDALRDWCGRIEPGALIPEV